MVWGGCQTLLRHGYQPGGDCTGQLVIIESGCSGRPPTGFPGFKSRHETKLSVTFVELNHQLSWLSSVTPRCSSDAPAGAVAVEGSRVRRQMQQLIWLHTVDSTRRLFRLVEDGKATIQQVTISPHRWPLAGVVPGRATSSRSGRSNSRCSVSAERSVSMSGSPIWRLCHEPSTVSPTTAGMCPTLDRSPSDSPDCKTSTVGSPAVSEDRRTGRSCSGAGRGCTGRLRRSARTPTTSSPTSSPAGSTPSSSRT